MEIEVKFVQDDVVLDLSTEGGQTGTKDYNDLKHKPSINGVALVGNKTTQDLHIQVSGPSMTETVQDEMLVFSMNQ